MTLILENETLDELRVGDGASIERSLNRRDLHLWAAVTGNPALDEDFVATRGVTIWAMSLFSTLIGSTLPGLGSVIQGATVNFHRPVAIGEKVTATVAVKELSADQGSFGSTVGAPTVPAPWSPTPASRSLRQPRRSAGNAPSIDWRNWSSAARA